MKASEWKVSSQSIGVLNMNLAVKIWSLKLKENNNNSNKCENYYYLRLIVRYLLNATFDATFDATCSLQAKLTTQNTQFSHISFSPYFLILFLSFLIYSFAVNAVYDY